MKSWLEKNALEIYSAHNERKFVLAKRFIRTLKNKIYKCVTSVSKVCVLINQMIQLINTIMSIIAQLKMKPVVLKSNTYINSSK